jgi:hypothetical protein
MKPLTIVALGALVGLVLGGNVYAHVPLFPTSSVATSAKKIRFVYGIIYQVLHHKPAYTSEEAARIRGTPLASGAKALICRGDDAFVMFVVPADRKL